MLDPKTKERIRQEAELPIYNDLVLPGIGKKFSAIERFVYDHQPVNSADAETFREQLKAVIVEAREAEATRAAGQWISLEPGNPLPDFDQQALWITKSGNCHIYTMDKDDSFEKIKTIFSFTHWRPLPDSPHQLQ